jgi:endogenous inhibitor of DNA gyrase (YacG/DUF329 family)
MSTTCPRCGGPGRPRRAYCRAECRDLDLKERPDRVAAVLLQRAEAHEARADELDATGRPDGARALRLVAQRWRNRAADLAGGPDGQ